jgi:hypothetical protein
MDRHKISNEAWERIKDIFLPEGSKKMGRPAKKLQDNDKCGSVGTLYRLSVAGHTRRIWVMEQRILLFSSLDRKRGIAENTCVAWIHTI